MIFLTRSGLMSTLSAGSEMQTPALVPQFLVGPQGKVPGRKRGRPPIRKLEFQSHYMEPMLPLKVPKKRGRKPGFKVSRFASWMNGLYIIVRDGHSFIHYTHERCVYILGFIVTEPMR